MSVSHTHIATSSIVAAVREMSSSTRERCSCRVKINVAVALPSKILCLALSTPLHSTAAARLFLQAAAQSGEPRRESQLRRQASKHVIFSQAIRPPSPPQLSPNPKHLSRQGFAIASASPSSPLRPPLHLHASFADFMHWASWIFNLANVSSSILPLWVFNLVEYCACVFIWLLFLNLVFLYVCVCVSLSICWF